MPGSLIINSNPTEVRVAFLEGGVPVEVYVERIAEQGVVGNIYRGRVVRVLPGMQAAFVDIGLDRTAFLYVNDALPTVPSQADDNGGDLASNSTGNEDGGQRGFRTAPLANIADILKQGQEILVQVQKEPLGTKGARLTRHVTIPGRNLVVMAFSDHIGVSRRIEDPKERERLKQVLGGRNDDVGFIVRTAAEGESADGLLREARFLTQMWKGILARGESGPTPRLIFTDLDLALRATRDLFTDDVDEVFVDNAADHARICEFVASFEPGGESRIKLYNDSGPIFDHFGVEVEIERALERRVWLKSGGYIVIDQAEALTVVDVNSGRFVGKSSLEDTITQINLEAVKEIVYQVRLRNIGGIIIIDFIDMAAANNREKVLEAMQEALKRDKAKTTIVRMSEIGLVEMTRKRVRESLGHVLTHACPYCKGRGFIKTEQTVANEILRAIVRTLTRTHALTVLVNMEPSVADYLYDAQTEEIERIEARHGTRVIPVAREGFHREHYEIVRT
ncbi:MAG: ribonuclease G [Deltaproteobacteria bacterium RIFOXYA12_FULL_58_15]|nr:MAG: ribonuclease G [Deltaproteobacteria bacterium RIFOXYA12_FULL_58_15]OGR09407.1 MAG: ribonuclease G [Deltaproteobacteria bacterium RIFOXYB12_FULL_58_9]